MTSREKFVLAIILSLGAIGLLAVLSYDNNWGILSPKGVIAEKQADLLLFTAAFSLLIVVPVFALTFGIAWKYRASNKKAAYRPNYTDDRKLEMIWWGVPGLMILVLSVITFNSSHDLDPFKPLPAEANVETLDIQVVALQWKWLFIYPKENIATINYVQFPEDRPVRFHLTSDGPMNSFWIPQLGGQIYAMAGMSSQIYLQANESGKYRGSSANISGEGFADMVFTAEAVSENQFKVWTAATARKNNVLDQGEYQRISIPGFKQEPTSYGSVDDTIYKDAILKYMLPR